MSTITYIQGDATRPEGQGNKIIAHCCNDLGKWGKGFVLALSARWKDPERKYKALKNRGGYVLGHVQMVKVSPDIYVANIIGQHKIGWSEGLPPVRYDAIRDGFAKVAEWAIAGSASVHMPRIGCGLAGGNWSVIEALIQSELTSRGVAVFVYDFKP